jgi:hypothetical protein
MVFQLEFYLGFFLEGLSKLLVDVDSCDVAVFKDNSELSELYVEFLDHGSGHISFQIEHLI